MTQNALLRYNIDMADHYLPFIESDPNADAQSLRARMDEVGYLFFRHLVPSDVVNRVRRDVLAVCQEQGWLDETHDMMDAFMRPGMEPLTEGKPDYMVAYRKILHTPSFFAFPTHPALMGVMSKVLDHPEPFVHPRRIGRVTWPNYESATTPPHQDHFYIRGAVATYSCWCPLGELPLKMGVLAVLPGSHKQGFIEHNMHTPGAVGGRGVPVDESQATWHTGDFHLGDALFFHSFMIHKALPNLSGNRLRLSTDNRYQRPKEAIEPGALLPHYNLQPEGQP